MSKALSCDLLGAGRFGTDDWRSLIAAAPEPLPSFAPSPAASNDAAAPVLPGAGAAEPEVLAGAAALDAAAGAGAVCAKANGSPRPTVAASSETKNAPRCLRVISRPPRPRALRAARRSGSAPRANARAAGYGRAPGALRAIPRPPARSQH